MDFDFSDLVGPFSALAAFVSAAIAYQANRNVAKSDRARQVREVSLLANKVVAATIHIDDLSNELKMGYQVPFYSTNLSRYAKPTYTHSTCVPACATIDFTSSGSRYSLVRSSAFFGRPGA